MSKNSKRLPSHWRTNFRDEASLPDIKVVRTNFLVNFVSIILALIFLYITFQREYTLYTLQQSVGEMQERLASYKNGNDEALELSSGFKKTSSKIMDLQKFYSAPFLSHVLLYELFVATPEDMLVESMSFTEVLAKKGKVSQLEYRMNITGSIEDPLILDKFKAAIEHSDYLSSKGLQASLDESLERDSGTGSFSYRLAADFIEAETVSSEKVK